LERKNVQKKTTAVLCRQVIDRLPQLTVQR